jgi:fumarate reductase flavoprotein subunit
MISRPTLIRSHSRQFEATAPVVIVGAGACGMAAALAACDAGAQTVILEQDRTPGGSTAMSYGGVCAAGTMAQRRHGLEDDPERFCRDILAMTRGQAPEDIARVIAQESGPTLDWLASRHAVTLDADPGWIGLGHSVARLHFPPTRSGAELVGMLARAVEAAGAHILCRARVSALHVDSEGRVIGARIERPDGTEDIGCERLILASCGFGANAEMVSKHIPELASARYFGHEGNRGDAHVWGELLGAAVADMGSYQALGSLSDPECIVVPPTLMMGGGFQVNARGERFHNELADVSGQALRVLDQPGAVSWMIYDHRLHQIARDGFAEYRDGEVLNAYRSADSLTDLAAIAGIDGAGLSTTCAEVATLKRDGRSDRFGRDFAGAPPLKPPFYAVRVTGALFHTQGGLVIDQFGRVLGSDGQTIANLYAGGGAARGVSGPGGWGYLPGMGLSAALTLGWLAGRHAARSLETDDRSLP